MHVIGSRLQVTGLEPQVMQAERCPKKSGPHYKKRPF